MAEFRYDRRPWSLNAERGRSHWAQARKDTAEWRQAFFVLGRQQRDARFTRVTVTVETVMKGRLADTGNTYPAAKAALDGLVDAGVLPDDTPDVVRALTFLAPRRPTPGEPEHLTVRLDPVHDNDPAEG